MLITLSSLPLAWGTAAIYLPPAICHLPSFDGSIRFDSAGGWDLTTKEERRLRIMGDDERRPRRQVELVKAKKGT